MHRETYSDLLAFIAVAQECSFTRAAARMGVSQSALSHTIRALEAKMGVRLLTRTTRSVSPTEAGERLLRNIAPRFEEIQELLSQINDLHDSPAGTVRISASENAAETVLWPKLAKLLPKFPDLKVEVVMENRRSDIVAERFDMGVRLGNEVSNDMAVVPISAGMQVAVVSSPAYLSKYGIPQKPHDLANHQCINLRMMTHGELYAWEFRKGKKNVEVRVDGQLIFNNARQILSAALAGFGLAYVPLEMARTYIVKRRLVAVLEEWSPAFPGYHLYYPGRKQLPRAMEVVIEGLRHRPDEED
ncbi:LysR family transcriptional regulator [Herbaspirillum chlorophenolicum]|uniref:LysR family transcriptional regulator n=1 Tax=Herbaspirillum chlorophenolicum TaxID=211589 RepID=UPI00067D4787|nr:LysR family transcriptional regulator [Herbaspirillum chlorophenolicum]